MPPATDVFVAHLGEASTIVDVPAIIYSQGIGANCLPSALLAMLGASAGAFATDSASADADRDSGAVALYGVPHYGRRDDRAGHRVDPTCRRRGTSKIHPVRAASNMANLYTHNVPSWSCLGPRGGVE